MTRPGWNTAFLLVVMVAGACAGASRRCAADPASTSPPLSFDGFFSASYAYNSNRPPSGTNQFRVFDVDDNTFKLDVVELVAQKLVAKPRDAGVRVDVTVGSSVPHVTAAAGLFRDASSGQAEDIDVQQAFASWIAPAGSGLRLDVGKFVTHLGYEIIQGYDGWNDQATRSFLFGYAIPFTHVGVRASYTASPRVNLMAMVVNGWDVARDNNRSKSIGAQIVLVPAGPVAITLNGMWGPELSGNDADSRTILDGVATFKMGERATLGVNGDWGTEQNAAGPGAEARWSGVAGYLRVRVTKSFALALRGEVFDDRDGVRTGAIQTLREITLTPELRLTPHLILRADARVDRSNLPVFETDTGSDRSQPTILLDVVATF